jgi:hypothetical protein
MHQDTAAQSSGDRVIQAAIQMEELVHLRVLSEIRDRHRVPQ